jgi:glycosyltransferase involved in cell wall biosynthesis
LQHNRYELVIAGEFQGDYFKRIQEQAARFGVSSRVKLLGPVDERDKYWYYKHSMAFVFPSLAEGFGIPPIEAMHFGKPVFLSDKTSLPEIGGDVAYYFRSFEPTEMQQAFESGMNHYQEQCPAEMIRQHASIFNWRTNAEEYMKIYRNLY